jgi:nucleoside-diphosphate-sugar epimerase
VREQKTTDVERVVVTGAAGYLGSHLMSALAAEGFEVTGVDLAQPTSALPEGARFVHADLSNDAAVPGAIEGADLIVHCASVHPWKGYDDNVYLDSNVKGTWHLYSAAAVAMGRVVMTSSVAAAGYGFNPVTWPVNEERQGQLYDLYSVTKHTQEVIARSFAGRGKVRTIALRPPAFFPVTDEHLGFWLTGSYMVVKDVVAAHVAAVRVMAGRQKPARPLAPFEAVFITNRLPYTARDAALCEHGDRVNARVVERHWPEAAAKLVADGYKGAWLPAVYDLSKAQELLSWEPTYGFDEWWADQRNGRAAKT